MKKSVLTLCAVAIGLFAMPQQAEAQFLQKLKNAAKEVVKETLTGEATSTTAEKSSAPGVNFVTSASGVSIGNPAAASFDLEFVEAVGNSMAGTVTIYLKATAKDLSYANARIGDNNVTAYDTDGNEYKTNDYAKAKNLAVGVPVKFELSKLVGVPATVTTLSVVQAGYYLNSEKSSRAGNLASYIQLRNVPVKWQ